MRFPGLDLNSIKKKSSETISVKFKRWCINQTICEVSIKDCDDLNTLSIEFQQSKRVETEDHDLPILIHHLHNPAFLKILSKEATDIAFVKNLINNKRFTLKSKIETKDNSQKTGDIKCDNLMHLFQAA